MLVGSALYPLLCEVIAGFSGGACKTLAFYPLDTLTTWRETRQSGSVKELYRGCLLTVAGGAPYAAVFHTAFWASAHALAYCAGAWSDRAPPRAHCRWHVSPEPPPSRRRWPLRRPSV